MVTLYFSKKFTKGNLIGIIIPDKLSFVDSKAAMQWVDGIIKNEDKLDYKLVNFTFNEK
jgi:hypothetical protein